MITFCSNFASLFVSIFVTKKVRHVYELPNFLCRKWALRERYELGELEVVEKSGRKHMTLHDTHIQQKTA